MNFIEILKRLDSLWFKNDTVQGFNELDKIEGYIGIRLPANYKYFLQFFSNGGESKFPLNYVLLFRVEEILERQRDYEMFDWAPNLLVIGLEGDDIFCFDVSSRRDTADYKIIKASLSSRDLEEAEIVADNFAEFLLSLVKN